MRVLEELRRLEEAQRRGEVEDVAVQKLRNDILSMVEDAEIDDTDGAIEAHETDVRTPNALWHAVVLAALGLVLFTAFMAWLFNDLSMGITLGIAALAVAIILAFQRLEDAREADSLTTGDPDEPELANPQ